MYLIELDKWKIQLGLSNKPYTDLDYIKADNNIKGINNALQYAYANGFTEVVLPKGQYAICYPRTIKMISNMTFNLNGSTLKVIYDSSQKSPFDTRTTTDYYNFKGNSIEFDNVQHAHLLNGSIIGCRDDRSFETANEAAVESTYGVILHKGSSHCSIKHCVVRDYMGDNISFSSSSTGSLVEFNKGLTLNRLDYTSGQPVSTTNTVITRLINLPKDLTYSSMMVTGAGYTRLTNLVSRDFDIFFYGLNDVFLGVLKSRKIYTDISIPVRALKFRLQFLDETNSSKTMQITIRWGSIPHHNLVEHNEVYNGHRGGITLGGSYNIIQHNVIRDNGKVSNRFLDNNPLFNDSTRYAINQEDSYGDNCVIRNNLIYGSYHGILAGCYSLQIEHNHIYNIDNLAINLYSLLHATIRGNFIYNCLNNIGLMTSNFEAAFVLITGNTFHSGGMNINNSNYEILLAHNNFVNPAFIITGENCTFQNNHIKFTATPASYVTIQAQKIEDCTFKSKNSLELTFKSYIYEGCSFNNIQINAKTLNSLTILEEIKMHRCRFSNSIIRNHVFDDKSRLITVTDSILIDTLVAIGIINTENQTPVTQLKDCYVQINTIPSLFVSDTNRMYSTFIAENTRIEINNPNFAYLLKSGSGAAVNKVILKQNILRYSGAQSLKFFYYSNKNNISMFQSADNTFINITLPAEDAGIYIGHDTEKQYKQTVTLQPNSGSYMATVTHNLNTLLPLVQCVSTVNNTYVMPEITILNSNAILIKYASALELKVTITRL